VHNSNNIPVTLLYFLGVIDGSIKVKINPIVDLNIMRNHTICLDF